MAYKLNVTEHANELLDNVVHHLIYRLKNKQAAKHLLDGIDGIYDRLEVNPYQFLECAPMPVLPRCLYCQERISVRQFVRWNEV